MKKYWVLIFLCANLLSISYSQPLRIISVSPSNLISGDTMFVEIGTSFPFNVGPAPIACGVLLSSRDSLIGNSIDLDVLFDITGVKSPASCGRVDTFEIILPNAAGNYLFYCHWRATDTLDSNINGQRYFRDSLAITINTISGIEEFSSNPIRFYPNPATDQLRIDAPSKSIESVSLFSMTGQLLLEGSQTNQIDLSGVAQGVYFLQVELSSGRKFSEKVFIN